MSEFTYTTESGDTITLPPVGQIPYGVLRKVRKLDPDEQDDALLESIADEATIDKIDALPVVEVAKLMNAWQRDAEVSVGESSASAGS